MTWILGYRDLPGVRKECPCYDDGADQNGETPSQSLKTLPRIRDRSIHRVQRHEPISGQNYARCAECLPEITHRSCPLCVRVGYCKIRVGYCKIRVGYCKNSETIFRFSPSPFTFMLFYTLLKVITLDSL